ncbi:DNA primase/helicase [Marinomonas phage CB5A]|uniref:DNA primase/helicase n=1 Tax=Marinomonas phage CB5A TaxID=2022859 RepID=A0A222G3I1_9CAUD|nr:DNA primase/helicase [Marinomonas phage CB5A]ASP46292.1 DNA primase/helicase [Marinomonas phage CB5A]
MGQIVKNIPCPKCRETGHDSTGNHAIVFSDGGVFCDRKHFHKNGKRYYAKGEEGFDVSKAEINGSIKYTPDEFRGLEKAGKLQDPLTRSLALSGMKMEHRYEVFTEEERLLKDEEWNRECEWFEGLKVKHLVDRGIHGLIARLFNVRVGHDEEGKIARHYYPRYEEGELTGAKCRTLPKDFAFGNLGKLFGDQDLFGLDTFKQVSDSGQRKNFCLVVGGECDAMAAQQMLVKQINGLDTLQEVSSLESHNGKPLKLFYVLSVNKGEAGVKELIHNKDELNQFKNLLFCFDDDETGRALNLAATKLFRGKAKTIKMPSGCKDPNHALDLGRDAEFTSAVFNAEESKGSAKVKRVSDLYGKARVMTKMGNKYWLNGLNMITYGIRLHYLHVWGAGTGVGKTDTTVAHVANLMEQGEDVVVIYLENQSDEVARTFAGMLVGKDFNSPPQEQWEIDMGLDENPARQYTQEDLDDALTQLAESDRLRIADLDGSKDVESVLEVMQECLALGYQYFVVDNLTAFEHKDDRGNASKGVNAIDETMKRLGTFKDENPVNIMLLSHLVKVDASKRIPHTQGGEVYESDFRGAGSITFWANAVWGIERNTRATTMYNKCVTLYRNIKNRGIGHMVGSTVAAVKDIRTGKYTELDGVHELSEVGVPKQGDNEQRERNSFDDGGRPNRSTPIKESKPSDLPSEEGAEASQEF